MGQISYEKKVIDEQIACLEDRPEVVQSLTGFIASETKVCENFDVSDKKTVEINRTKERLWKDRRHKEVASRLDISTAMLRKKLYHKDLSRDWIIAICGAYGFDANQAGNALFICSQPCFDDEVKRDRVIQRFLNGHKDRPATLSAFNAALTDEGQMKLRIQKRNSRGQTKEKITVLPYKIIGPIKVQVLDFEGDPYNSLSTEYRPNQLCKAMMLLQDDSGIKYQLTAFSDGKYLLKTEHELLSRYLSFDSGPDFSEYMVQLSEAARKRKRECDDVFHDSRNYRGRYSANIKNDSIHVFYEEYNYWNPERGEYFLMEYCNGHYSLSVSRESMFMKEYLSKEEYYTHYHTRKRIDRKTYTSIEEIEIVLAETSDWYGKNLLCCYRKVFNQLKSIVEQKLNAIRNQTVLINNIDFIWDNQADVLRYYNIEELFGCRYDSEDGEICDYQKSICVPYQGGTETIITFEDIISAFKLGFENFEQINRVKSEKGSIDAVLR